jgi:hypothetical protein
MCSGKVSFMGDLGDNWGVREGEGEGGKGRGRGSGTFARLHRLDSAVKISSQLAF